MQRSLPLCLAALAAAAVFGSAAAEARIIQIGTSALNPLLNPVQCDVGTPLANQEIGGGPTTGGPFAAVDDISWTSTTTTASACTQTDVANTPNTLVTITNNSGRRWDDLWFVADGEVIFPATGGVLPVLTNAELEIIEQLPLGGGSPGTAFRIDNLGNNQPLLGESLNADLVFEPNETWTFVVQDWAALSGFTGGCGSSVGTVTFGSLGVGGISCNSVGSNASIIARLVPEPAAPAILALGLVVLAALRRRKAR